MGNALRARDERPTLRLLIDGVPELEVAKQRRHLRVVECSTCPQTAERMRECGARDATWHPSRCPSLDR